MSFSTHVAPERAQSRCPRCGAAFECGREAGRTGCWCADAPKIDAARIVPGMPCLCPRCLAARPSSLSSHSTG
ncbi:cysteine-rich CWC family protein [Trinickia sp. LjRoot230]|uniref:cysteine-rich CWC family protein n=1 Tax=Trinickia sp. LjRoot230 TaxID=3342288 RepID=UPI003ECDFF67